jgi:hypothetical protein
MSPKLLVAVNPTHESKFPVPLDLLFDRHIHFSFIFGVAKEISFHGCKAIVQDRSRSYS